MRGHEALASALAREGTEVVFGVMGDGNMLLVGDLVERHGVRFVAARHEAGAVAMADGYARSTGRPGICTVTHGPGLTQCGTPLTVARLAGSPVLVVAGDTPASARLHVQNIDQSVFASATTGRHVAVRSNEALGEDVWLSFRHLRTGRGPVVLSAPVDIQEAEMPREWQSGDSGSSLAGFQRRLPDPVLLDELVARVAAAQRPVLIAGRGAIGSGEAVTRLADRVGALLATTLPAKGLFTGSPRDLGVAGGFSSERARSCLGEADLVVAFGASLSRFTADHGKLFPKAFVAQVELDAEVVGDPVATDLVVLGDAGLVAAELTEQVATRSGWDLASLPGIPAYWNRADYVIDDPLGLDPRQVLDVADGALPSERVVVVGIGHYSGMGALGLACPPGGLVLPWELGAVGMALGVGLGAAIGRPDRLVVVVEGDGGILMSLPEVETAAREGIPVVVLVLDDSAYGAELHQLVAMGRDPSLARFSNPDLAEVARSLGCEGHRPESIEQLGEALGRIGRPLGPVVVAVPISQRVVHHEVFAALRP